MPGCKAGLACLKETSCSVLALLAPGMAWQCDLPGVDGHTSAAQRARRELGSALAPSMRSSTPAGEQQEGRQACHPGRGSRSAQRYTCRNARRYTRLQHAVHVGLLVQLGIKAARRRLLHHRQRLLAASSSGGGGGIKAGWAWSARRVSERPCGALRWLVHRGASLAGLAGESPPSAALPGCRAVGWRRSGAWRAERCPPDLWHRCLELASRLWLQLGLQAARGYSLSVSNLRLWAAL